MQHREQTKTLTVKLFKIILVCLINDLSERAIK